MSSIFFLKKTSWFLFIGLILFLSAVQFNSQTPGLGRVDLSSDARYNEWQLKSLQQRRRESASFDSIAWKKIDEDFKGLQIANNELHKAVFIEQTSDRKYLKNILDKLNECSERLRDNLPLPSGESLKNKADDQDLPFQDLVKQLDETVLRFKSNPVFREIQVIDLENAAQAGRDLRLINLLADRLKKQVKNPD